MVPLGPILGFTATDQRSVFLASVLIWHLPENWDDYAFCLGDAVGVILNRKTENYLKLPLIKWKLLSLLSHFVVVVVFNWNWKYSCQILSYSLPNLSVATITCGSQLLCWRPGTCFMFSRNMSQIPHCIQLIFLLYLIPCNWE